MNEGEPFITPATHYMQAKFIRIDTTQQAHEQPQGLHIQSGAGYV